MSTAQTTQNTRHEALDVCLFGEKFRVGSPDYLLKIIFEHIDQNSKTPLFLAHHNMHSLAISLNDSAYNKAIHSCRYFWLDGMSVVWMLRKLGFNISTDWRVTFLDWQHPFFELASERKARVFLLGGGASISKKALLVLTERYKSIAFVNHHGYFKNNDKMISKINNFSPDILLVGLGMPNQELWIFKNKEKLECNIVMPIGGYLDYIAGNTYTPPRWSGKIGLEWFFRLLFSPLRLGRRYLIEPWPVLYMFSKELIKYKNSL